MLTKLEDIYLNILRIAVLAIATIALLVFALTAAQTGPLVGQFIGLKPKAKVEDASFAQFVHANRPTSSSNSYGSPDASDSLYPDTIVNSATNVVAYIKKHHDYDIGHANALQFLGGIYDEMSADYQRDYAISLQDFTTQLANSTGTPISTDQINQAIRWHAQKFMSAATESEIKATADRAKAVLAITIAGISLLAFLIIIFLFVVVKIERNLRVVQVNKLTSQP